jgi:pyridoxamine 5'-phosphate oxidase-like protein
MTRAGDELQMTTADGMGLPSEVGAVFGAFRTCEFSTLTRDGAPITWPTATLWQPEEDRFVITTSIGLVQKALNVRRNPKVSLLFSDPTASGLENPPAVLVQGEAEVTEGIKASPAGFEEYWRRLFERQPAGKIYGSNPLTRYLMDWYYMRLYIFVRPRRITRQPQTDLERGSYEEVRLAGRLQEIAKYLPGFPTAVLNGLDAEGYPYSVRCRSVPDRSAGVPKLALPTGIAIEPGPASLLCHSHDERLWDLKSFLVRGRLEQPENGRTFVSERFVPGGGIGGPLGTAKAVIGMRRTATRYLKKRSLARPPIPWDEIEALKGKAQRR